MGRYSAPLAELGRHGLAVGAHLRGRGRVGVRVRVRVRVGVRVRG